MSPLTPPVPIALIGIHTEIGEAVAKALRPDWDIVRFMQTFEAAQADLPYLLRGETPPAAPTNDVGSGVYAQPVRAVLMGRGFTQQQGEALHEQFKDVAESSVLWAVGADANRPPWVGGRSSTEPPPGIEKVVVAALRGVLEAWKKGEEGAEGGEEKEKKKKKGGVLVLY
ncbi:hypothetical protein F4824DRAFT_187416 [Ustulina deusta]|nr:hypothetical protein F4824DRAFT_187416 [Ustulina deusta]